MLNIMMKKQRLCVESLKVQYLDPYFVAFAILHQPRPTDLADINVRDGNSVTQVPYHRCMVVFSYDLQAKVKYHNAGSVPL